MAANRLIVTPKNEAEWHGMRAMDVTSTESAALFEMSPYTTKFELFHSKRATKLVILDAAGRMLWGQRMQNTIARGIAEDYGVKVRRLNAYARLTTCRMGASFDFEVVGVTDTVVENPALQHMYQSHGVGILEIKNVDSLIFKQQWSAERDAETGAKEYEAPAHIEIQVQHQLHAIDRGWSVLGVLVGGNTPIVIVRERDEEVGNAIEGRVRHFWQSIADNAPPPPVMPDDAEFVCKLYGFAEPGKVYDGRADEELLALCEGYSAAAEIARQADEDKKIAKAKIFTKIGDHERALLNGYSISAAMVAPADISFHRDGFRGFRVTKLRDPAVKPTKERKAA